MGKYYNHAKYNKTKQKLRNNSTIAEQLLWNHLKAKQFHGIKFRRQYNIGRYILDFYAPSIRLAIEIDGIYHNEVPQKEYDKMRESDLSAAGIKVIRFTNEEVYSDLAHILSIIDQNI